MRGASGLMAGIALAFTVSSCSSTPDREAAPTSTIPSTTVSATSTTTTVPSLLPTNGTIPLAQLGESASGVDLVESARRAVATWQDAPVECFESKAEALAARDQFARVATYLAKVRSAARDLGDAQAFKAAIETEAGYRAFAATRRFLTCKAAAAQANNTQSTTTVPGGTTKGLAAGGVAEVDLTISGDPAVDQEFTVADVGAACDGVGANTTFLVSSQDTTGRWVIVDVIVDAGGTTSASIVPTRSGAAAIEYLAYCGTQDKRHGVTTFRVRAGSDTTTTAPTTTTPDPDAPLAVVDLAIDGSSIVVDPSATELAVEPESVSAFLTAAGAEGGVVIARANAGEWVALREGQVSWIPVGPGEAGLETKIVGAKTPVDRTFQLTPPTTTTTTTIQAVVPDPTSSLVEAPTTAQPETDSTIWVIAALLAIAALAVIASRLRLRR